MPPCPMYGDVRCADPLLCGPAAVLQKLELAHVVVSRRLQEAGALGSDYVPGADRNNMILREAQRGFTDAGGDAQAAAEDAERSLGRYLDRLPTAQEAIDYHLSTSAFHCHASCHILTCRTSHRCAQVLLCD